MEKKNEDGEISDLDDDILDQEQEDEEEKVSRKKKKYLPKDIIKLCTVDMVEELEQEIDDSPWLLDLLSEEKKSLIIIAAEEGSSKSAAMLINKGCDVNICRANGDHSLLICAKIGFHYPAQMEIIRMLLDSNKVGVDHCNFQGETAFLVAAKLANFPLASALLAKGADINFGGRLGNTALIRAGFFVYNQLDIIKFLIDNKASLNKANMNGETAFIAACKHEQTEAAILLANSGADINAQDNNGRTGLMVLR